MLRPIDEVLKLMRHTTPNVCVADIAGKEYDVSLVAVERTSTFRIEITRKEVTAGETIDYVCD
jgi:hypothetical protein